MRRMLSGLTCLTCPADTVVRVVDGGLCGGAVHAAASSIDGMVNQHGRTPVDTTDWFGHSATSGPWKAMYSMSTQHLKRRRRRGYAHGTDPRRSSRSNMGRAGRPG